MDQIHAAEACTNTNIGHANSINLGESKIILSRSVLWMRKRTSKTCEGTVVLVLSDAGSGIGRKLWDHYRDPRQAKQVVSDPFWIIWSMFHNLTDWYGVFRCISRRLEVQVYWGVLDDVEGACADLEVEKKCAEPG